MRWILWSITLLMLLLGALVLVGGLLPREHTVTHAAEIAAAPEIVYATIADLEGMPSWRPGVVQVKRLADEAGRPVYREASVHGPVTYTVQEARPPARLVLGVRAPGIAGTWAFDIAPAGTGTRVAITEQARIENPMVRFLSRFVTGHGKVMQAYLDALVRHRAPDRMHIE